MPRTICTLNLNGIRSAERRGFSRWLRRSKPDVLCVQELRAQRGDVEDELYAPAGYNARWLSAAKKGYSGVALYSRSAPDRYAEGTSFAHCADEGRVLRADLDELSVVSLYVPSGSSSPERLAIKLEYMERFLGHARVLLAEKRPIALCGDMNVAPTALDLARPKQNEKNSGFLPEERAWFTAMERMGWVDVVRARNPGVAGLYSWWSNRGRAREKDVGWRLDHVLCSPELASRVKRAWIEKKAGLSDHAPVWVELEA
ncbi:MAG: exodeoxyribonuclease III [Planctomycetes bacterium]|nr:exodeoxyribonuclease III [Planctomycetota bacterium]